MFIELHRVDCKELRRLKSRKKEIWKEISMQFRKVGWLEEKRRKEQNYEYDKKQILYEAIIWQVEQHKVRLKSLKYSKNYSILVGKLTK